MKTIRRNLHVVLAAAFFLMLTQTNSSAQDSGPQLVPSGEVPNIGTFWLITPNLFGGYSLLPCPPVSAFNEPPYAVYYVDTNLFLVDDTAETGGLNADQLNAEENALANMIAAAIAAEAAQALASPMTRFSMMASSLATAYAYGNPVYLTNMAANFAYDGSMTANFSIAGGTNFVPYDRRQPRSRSVPVSRG
jgi:hypothetical protein